MTDCGFVASCGRPATHRGAHGGWRTNVHAVAPNPVVRPGRYGTPELGRELPPQALRAAAEVLTHGSIKEAAACMGIALPTAKKHISLALTRTGASSYGHLGVVLGWTTFPVGLGHDIEAAS